MEQQTVYFRPEQTFPKERIPFVLHLCARPSCMKLVQVNDVLLDQSVVNLQRSSCATLKMDRNRFLISALLFIFFFCPVIIVFTCDTKTPYPD